MAALSIIAMAVFSALLSVMSMTAGTQHSISALAYKWRWLLLAALWSQVLLLPQMLDITPSSWQWLAFLGIGGVVFCGGATIYEKTDYWVHLIAAVATFVCLTGWVMVIDAMMLLPLIVCLCAGRDRLVWRAEVGLIISVYMSLAI